MQESGELDDTLLELTARVADGWVPSFRDFDHIDAMVRRLDHALAAAGRSPADLRRVINVSGTVTDGASKGHFDGPVGQWVDDIGELAVSYGFDTFGFWGEGDRQLARFAEEVVPAVRDQLTVG